MSVNIKVHRINEAIYEWGIEIGKNVFLSQNAANYLENFSTLGD